MIYQKYYLIILKTIKKQNNGDSMELKEVIYIDSLPSIDLHGFDRDYARVRVNEFINDNLKMKNEIVCIVHGIGSGILKETVHNTLKLNKYVSDYKLFYNNVGCTIVKINLNKNYK